MVGAALERSKEWKNVMEEQSKSERRGIRRNVWVNTAAVLLLLVGVVLGITQAFILLAVYTLIIVPA